MTATGPGTEYYPPPDLPEGVPPPRQTTGESGSPQDREPPRPMTPERRMMIIASVVIILVSAAFIIRNLVFTIRHVRVVGTQSIGWDQVARSAGLSPSSSFFNLKEDRIRDGINSNRYLIYEGMETVFPSTVVLFVRERRPIANIHYIGISYIMAEDGMILERTKDLNQYPDLMTISGLDLRDIRQGSYPMSTKVNQMDVCVELTRELVLQGFSSQVKDINLSELSNIYLSTRDGFSIHLGYGSELRAKIGTVRAVVDECRRRGYQPGVIEATVPGEATYRPDVPA